MESNSKIIYEVTNNFISILLYFFWVDDFRTSELDKPWKERRNKNSEIVVSFKVQAIFIPSLLNLTVW